MRESFVCPNGCHSGFYGILGALYDVSMDSLRDSDVWYAVNSFNWRIENWDMWENFYNFYEIMDKFKAWLRKNGG